MGGADADGAGSPVRPAQARAPAGGLQGVPRAKGGPVLKAGLVALLALTALVTGCATTSSTRKPTTPGTLEERGLISWYGYPHHGKPTANGEVYDMHAMTAAHKTLPFGTWLEVENLQNGQTTNVRVNDRGPFVKGRILDVSRSAAVALGMMGAGVTRGRLRVIPRPASALPEPAPVFVVQVGAYGAEPSAHDLRRRLGEAGFDVEVTRLAAAGQILYRVRSGRFAARDEAEAHAAKLQRAGYKGIVVPVPPIEEP